MDIYEFLTDLATDPHKQLQFAAAPESLLTAMGVSTQQELDAKLREFNSADWNCAQIFIDPSYDPPPPPPPRATTPARYA